MLGRQGKQTLMESPKYVCDTVDIVIHSFIPLFTYSFLHSFNKLFRNSSQNVGYMHCGRQNSKMAPNDT